MLCLLFAYRGASHLAGLRAELEDINQQNLSLDLDNRNLYRQVQRLRDDPQAMEQACREELGLLRPDEIVYQRPGEPTGPPGNGEE
jgi:cell division protein FtsB